MTSDDEEDWSYAHGEPDERLETPERMLEYALLGLRGYATAATMLGESLRTLDEGRRRPLVAALASSDRYGAPLGAGLVRLADDVRLRRRRRAEEAARRVPVQMLFPLVGCSLPAFALLIVAPLIASGLGSLRP